MRVNRMNVDAMDLLDANRGFEAVALLHKAQQLDGSNPFTLNNLGVADETIGDFAGALKAYDDAAMTRSNERVLVTADKAWRGKSVSAMAWDSAKRLQSRISKMDAGEQSSVLYTVRGVSATNQNNLTEARADFLKAYSLDPKSAFSINNRGFVAEIDGDVETAEFYYDKARRAGDANARIGLSTQPGAEGKRLLTVAADSDHLMGDELDRYSQQRRRDNSPVELTPRGDASNAGAKSPSGQPLAVPPPAQPQQ
jgi:tetratricopeptide (TPR) repeat protein